MTTRALQIDFLMDSVFVPGTNSLASGYTVKFFAAGTSTPKNVWTEKEKTNAYTSRTLSSHGTTQVYGDGVYDIGLYENATDDTAVKEWTYVKVQANTFTVQTKSDTYTATADDDLILCDGTFTLNIATVTGFTHPLTIKRLSGTITVDPYSTETIDSSSTLTLNSNNSLAILYPDVSAGIWRLAKDNSVEQDGTFYVTDNGATATEYPMIVMAPNATQTIQSRFGKSGNNYGYLGYYYAGDENAANEFYIGHQTGGGIIRIMGSGVVAVHEYAGSADFGVYGSAQITGTADIATFSRDGTVSITDTGNTTTEYPLRVLTPNLQDSGSLLFFIGKEVAAYNSIAQRFYLDSDDSQSNYATFGLHSAESIKVNGYGNVGIDNAPAGSGGAKLTVNGAADVSSTLDIGAGTTRRVAPAGSFVTGTEVFIGGEFVAQTSITASTWESVGPTGASADNTWTALNSVPSDADWVEIKINITVLCGSATGDTNYITSIHGRETGSSEAIGTADTLLCSAATRTNASGNGIAKSSSSVKVPIDSSRRFDLYWTGDGASSYIYVDLVGWGFNP